MQWKGRQFLEGSRLNHDGRRLPLGERENMRENRHRDVPFERDIQVVGERRANQRFQAVTPRALTFSEPYVEFPPDRETTQKSGHTRPQGGRVEDRRVQVERARIGDLRVLERERIEGRRHLGHEVELPRGSRPMGPNIEEVYDLEPLLLVRADNLSHHRGTPSHYSFGYGERRSYAELLDRAERGQRESNLERDLMTSRGYDMPRLENTTVGE